MRVGRQARVLMFDVANRAEARQALEADMQDHGAYYGVVLNAGLTRDAREVERKKVGFRKARRRKQFSKR